MTIDLQALITGATRLIGIVGDPVVQVRSPELYNPRLAKAGANAVLIPLHVPAATFERTMPALQQLGNLAGLIFTVPFKERAAAFSDEILPTGQQVGAVNAMRRAPDGRWIADMFDGAGLVRALAGIGAPPAGKRILLIGAGGAGRAIAMSLARAGTAALTLCDLDAAKLAQLASDVRRFYPDCTVTASEPAVAAGHEIVVNATPVGMSPGDGLPIPIGPLDPGCTIFDIVPKPDVTPLMAYGLEAGCKVGGGRLMVDGQADAVLEFLGFGA
jgi:shikimate dehydrogenase